jgi:uncharacterized protein YjbJ (UPF0337 family)
MKAHRLEGRWTELCGTFRECLGRIRHREADIIAGKREQIIGILQQHYDAPHDVAARQVKEFAHHILAIR